MFRKILTLILATFLLASTVGCGSTTFSESTAEPNSLESSEPEPTPEVDLTWAPKSFSQYDEKIAYKFTTAKGSSPCQDCNYWKITVIANYGCTDGVYAELNMMDSSGTVIDWSNDSIPYLGPGQKAVLTFKNYPWDSNLETGQLTKLTCY